MNLEQLLTVPMGSENQGKRMMSMLLELVDAMMGMIGGIVRQVAMIIS